MFGGERGEDDLMWRGATQLFLHAAQALQPARALAHAAQGMIRAAPPLMSWLPLLLSAPGILVAGTPAGEDIHLELSPRICIVGAHDTQCQTQVHAHWSTPHEESLCLVVLDRPEVKHCWEHYSQGTYSLYLTFVDDLTFQLRDPSLQNILASEVLRVIREALHYRHRRREPWNIFE